jgi:hypothetical protein
MKKKFAVVLGALSFVYIFVPDPSDIVPVLGWLDEGMAAALLMWSLRTLGVTPSSLLGRFGAQPEPARIRDVEPRRS